jgi:hypothetical protein
VSSLHDHALNNIRYIRDAMERASAFTSIPGWGGVVIGITAIATAAIAHGRPPGEWLVIWLGDAVVAAMIGGATMIFKARRAAVSFSSRAARRFFVSYFAPLFAAAALTFVLWRAGSINTLPALWLLLYGTSFISSGAFSIRVVPVMGLCFVILGLAACFVSFPAANILLGIGFGGLHILFGYIIARSYGG